MGSARDFDFFVGTFDSTHRRLVKPLTGSDEWDEFTGHSVAQPIFGGKGNFDETDVPDSRLGRLHDPAVRRGDRRVVAALGQQPPHGHRPTRGRTVRRRRPR